MIGSDATQTTNASADDFNSSSNALLHDWLIPALALLITVTLLWLPFGVKTTGLVEEWGVMAWLQKEPLFFLTENTSFASHRARPLEVSTHTIAYLLTPDSFIGYNLLHWLFLFGKGIFAFALLRQLTSNRLLAFFTAVLFLLYPADTGLFTFRALPVHCVIFLLLLAMYLLVVYWRKPRWYTLLLLWAALAASLLMYEVGYPLAMIAPLILMYLGRKIDWHLIRVSLVWYVVPIITVLRSLAIITQPGTTYQAAVLSGRNLNFITPLLQAYRRVFIGGWEDAARGFDSVHLLVAVIIAMIVFACGLWLNKRMPPIPMTLRQELQQTGWLLLIGLAIIGLGYMLYLLSPVHILQTMRTYLIPSLGGSLCLASVLWLALRAVRFRRLLFCLAMTLLIGVAAVSTLNNHQHYHDLSLFQQRLLGQLVRQAPGETSDYTLIIIDSFGYFNEEYSFANGKNFTLAVDYLYGDVDLTIKTVLCHPYEIVTSLNTKCTFRQDGIAFFAPDTNGTLDEKLYPYDKVILFDLTPAFDLVLLNQLPIAEYVPVDILSTAYSVPASISNAALPRRATSLFACWPVETCIPPVERTPQSAVHIDFGDTIYGLG